jgi:hypothetical protein
MQCKKDKRDGVQCRASALSGRKLCALHSEVGKAAELGSKGGRRRTVYNPEGLKEFSAPKSAADLRDLLAQSSTVARLTRGNAAPLSWTCICYRKESSPSCIS